MTKWTKSKLTVIYPKSMSATHTPVELVDDKGYEIFWGVCQCERGLKEKISTIDLEKGNAERLASCWNALLNFENPEKDITEIVEALKGAKSYLSQEYILGRFSLDSDLAYSIGKALSLYKEGG